MRLEEFLINEKALTPKQAVLFFRDRENIYTDDEEREFIELWKKITKDCQPFLREIRKGSELVYRGMGNHRGNGLKDVRKNRNPVDTSKKVSQYVDKVLYDMFGWHPRSEGLFVTGDLKFGQRYGALKAVFPVGRFIYLWSPTTRDSYNQLRDSSLGMVMLDNNEKELIKIWEDEYGKGHEGGWELNSQKILPQDRVYTSSSRDYAIRFFKDKIEQSGITIENIDKWLDINVHWKPALDKDQWKAAIRYGEFVDWEKWPKGLEELFLDAIERQLVDVMKYKDTDFQKATQLGNEIQLNCDKYYYIDMEFIPLIKMVIWGR